MTKYVVYVPKLFEIKRTHIRDTMFAHEEVLRPEVEIWLQNNCEGNFHGRYNDVYFDDRNDLIKFKLKYGDHIETTLVRCKDV